MSAANFNAPGGSMGADQLSPEQAEAEAMKVRFSRSSISKAYYECCGDS